MSVNVSLKHTATKTRCSICGHEELKKLIDLPSFPFTGIFQDPEQSLSSMLEEGVDQGFLLCEQCGHGQLETIIDPRMIYDHTYKHRGSTSNMATSGNRFLQSL